MQLNDAFVKKFSLNNNELYEFALYCGLAFLFPLIFNHLYGLPNQIFIGTSVNFLLVLCALYVSGWKNILIIVLPSIGAYLSGLIFGINSIFLMYFLPAIWIGNFLYIYLIKRMVVLKNNAVYGVLASSFVKSGFLFLTAILLISLKLVPDLFLIAMGPLQLATALLGGFLGLIFHMFRVKQK